MGLNEKEMKIQIDEVDAVAWLDETDIRRSLTPASSREVLAADGESPGHSISKAWMAEDECDTRTDTVRWVPTTVSFNNDSSGRSVNQLQQPQSQRLALGTSFVLSKWLQRSS